VTETSTTRTTETTTTSTFHCTPTKAGEIRVQCGAEEQCIREDWLCDGGKPDCDNGHDEVGCETTKAPTEPPLSCKYDEQMCDSNDKCYKKTYACDGETDCKDKSDEKDCATEPTTVTTMTKTTATVTTKTKQTTSYTQTTTTTTQHLCLTSGKCPTKQEFEDASNEDPLYATTAECRACVLGKSEDVVCASKKTAGCAGDTAEETADIAAKAAAELFRSFRVSLVASTVVRAEDFLEAFKTALLVGVPEKSNGTAVKLGQSQLIDIEMEGVAGSDYDTIVVFTKKLTGGSAIMKNAASEFIVKVGKAQVDVTVYNNILMDVDAADGPVLRATTADGEVITTTMAGQTDAPPFATEYVRAATLFFPSMFNEALFSTDAATLSALSPEDIMLSASFMDLTIPAGFEAAQVRTLVEAENAKRMEASAAAAAAKAGDAKASGSGLMIAVVIVVLLLGVGLVGGLWYVNNKRAAPRRPMNVAGTQYANNSVSIPMGEINSPGVPAWADSSVPFLSRAEAEAMLQQAGSVNGAFVIRQSNSNARGYIITTCHSGKVQNIQLKRQNETLFYGPKSCGESIGAAIQTLKNTIPVAPKEGAHFFLTQECSGSVGEMDA
jgi:hypothetical protein